MASLYWSQGRYGEAEPLLVEALEIRKSELGDRHPNTASSLNNLALLYQKQERYAEAIALLKDWQSIKVERQETQSQSYAMGLRTMGSLYQKNQQLSQALQMYEQSLSILSREIGSKHPAVLIFKGEIGRLKKRIKQQSKRRS